MPYDWCKTHDKGFIQPDLVFFFDIDAEALKERSGYGEERYEKFEFQQRVYEMFTKLKQEYHNNKHWYNVHAQGLTVD